MSDNMKPQAVVFTVLLALIVIGLGFMYWHILTEY
jgi:hypothetical protein